MEILIRPFEKRDMDPLYFLDQRGSTPQERVPYARLLNSVLEANALVLVAVPEGRERALPVVGALVAHHEETERRLMVRWLLVDPVCRRAGLGRHLLAHAEQVARFLKTGSMALAMAPGEDELAFLEALGFADSGETRPRLLDGDPRPLWVRPVTPAPPEKKANGEEQEDKQDDETAEG